MIGGYQICFKKRFAFNYMAETDLVCYAIRKKNWGQIMSEYPDYERNIRTKIFAWYFT